MSKQSCTILFTKFFKYKNKTFGLTALAVSTAYGLLVINYSNFINKSDS